MNTCRFCKSHMTTRDKLVKYGTRHYAHFACYLDAGKSLSDLRDWQIMQFPFRLIVDRGLREIAEHACAREQARLGEDA
jgi:hypothetical protein